MRPHQLSGHKNRFQARTDGARSVRSGESILFVMRKQNDLVLVLHTLRRGDRNQRSHSLRSQSSSERFRRGVRRPAAWPHVYCLRVAAALASSRHCDSPASARAFARRPRRFRHQSDGAHSEHKGAAGKAAARIDAENSAACYRGEQTMFFFNFCHFAIFLQKNIGEQFKRPALLHAIRTSLNKTAPQTS